MSTGLTGSNKRGGSFFGRGSGLIGIKEAAMQLYEEVLNPGSFPLKEDRFIGKIASGFLIIFLGALLFYIPLSNAHTHEQAGEGGRMMRKVKIRAPKGVLVAEIADTEPLRLKGLLGKSELKENRGMLLDFIRTGYYAIHMRGMAFPIDAVWIDETGRVVNLYQNIKPDSGRVYPSVKSVRYCLEIRAGSAKLKGLTVGSRVRFGPE
jgi:hypothetical protein